MLIWVGNKHSSLLRTFVNYPHKDLSSIGPTPNGRESTIKRLDGSTYPGKSYSLCKNIVVQKSNNLYLGFIKPIQWEIEPYSISFISVEILKAQTLKLKKFGTTKMFLNNTAQDCPLNRSISFWGTIFVAIFSIKARNKHSLITVMARVSKSEYSLNPL
jgi:hypothetical protein